MPGEEIAARAEQVAEAAAEVVADANATAAEGAAVNKALIAAQLESVHEQRLSALDASWRTENEGLRAELRAAIGRLEQCETQLTEVMAAKETSSTPPTSTVVVTEPPPSDAADGPRVNPETLEPDPPPPPPPRPKTRHLI